MTIRPMLATPSGSIHPDVQQALDALCTSGEWTFEPKYDGVRCIANLADHNVPTLTTRSGNDITLQFPEIVVALMEHAPIGIYDGELISGLGTGDFSSVSGRVHMTPDAAARAAATSSVRYLMFDVLDDLRLPHYRRSDILLDRMGGSPTSTLHAVLPHYDGHLLWKIITDQKGEGLIAKHRQSPYTPGRSPKWIKLKHLHTASCIVVGYEEGEGSRKGRVGALQLAVMDGTEIVPVGKVGTGFTDHDLDNLMLLIQGGQPFVVEVEYQSFTTGNKLRFPSYQGIRFDLTWADCTLGQFT